MAGDDGLGAEAVLHGHHHRVAGVAVQPRGGQLEVERLAGDDADVKRRQRRRVVGGEKLDVAFVLAADPQAVLAQHRRVLGAAGQHADLADGAEMARQQAADRAGPDHADARDRHQLATARRKSSG